MSRSQSTRTMPFATSAVSVKLESPRKRDSPLTLLDWPGSQCLAVPFDTLVLSARSASAPPSASTACLTRSAGAWADAGCTWPTATHRAADSRSAYLMQSSLNDFRKLGLGLVLGLVVPPSRADPPAVPEDYFTFMAVSGPATGLRRSICCSRAMPQRFQCGVGTSNRRH